MLSRENVAEKSAEFLRSLSDASDDCQGEGRGIVICGGGIGYGSCAYILIRLLRHLGCQLPVELWCLNEDECDPQLGELLLPLNATFIDASKIALKYSHPRLGGWELKSYAILHSRFREVLFLDADNVPTRDPEYLFDTREYRDTGAIFWPDPPQCRRAESCPAWEVFQVPYEPGPDQESGQLVVDKSRSWKPLQLCNWYNENSGFFYRFVYGDKDTFHLAWRRLRHPFAWIPHFPSDKVSRTISQHDFDGNVLFQHRHAAKWSLYGRNLRLRGFLHEELCLGFLDELRSHWDPMIHLSRDLTDVDRQHILQLEGRRFIYDRPGFNRWQIRLGDRGRVEEGYGPNESFWLYRDERLHLLGVDGRCRTIFRPTGERDWESEITVLPKMLPRLHCLAS